MPDEARDGRNVALIDKCFMVCSIVQRRIKLLTTEANNLVKYTSWPWANFELLAQELEVACFRPCTKTNKKKTIHIQLSRQTWTLEACMG